MGRVSAGLYQRGSSVLWAAFLLMLPITSMPLVRKLARAPTVNPGAVIPLVLLLIMCLIPYLLRNGYLPRESRILVTFMALGVAASGLALFMPLFPYKGQEPLVRSLKAILALVAGASFYFTTTALVRSEADLRRALCLINVGASVMMAWALLQAWYIIFRGGSFPAWMHVVHRWISIRDMIPGRVTGFSYEPSWMAHQLSALYFPIWLGMLLNGSSLYRFRVMRIPVEGMLIVLGLILVFLGKSRIGLVSFFAITSVIGLVLSWRLAGRIYSVARTRVAKMFPRAGSALGSLAAGAVVALIALLFLSSSIGAAYVSSRLDWRMEKLFSADFAELLQSGEIGLFSYPLARMLKFAERTAYWEAGYRVFEEHPILGVGLGNAGFLFWEKIPDYGLRAPEVVNAVRPDTNIFPNPKNLWIRLLAETGIVGFALYATWLIAVLLRSIEIWRCREGLIRGVGVMGVLAFVSILSEGFSLDTFGLPYSWVALGLVSGTAMNERAARGRAPSE